jgi:hypothetical protein
MRVFKSVDDRPYRIAKSSFPVQPAKLCIEEHSFSAKPYP